MIDIFTNINPIGLVLQNQIMGYSNISAMPSQAKTALVILAVLVIFEFIAIYYVFLAYREFKGMEYDATGAAGMSMMGQNNPVGRAAQVSGSSNNAYNGNGTAYGSGDDRPQPRGN